MANKNKRFKKVVEWTERSFNDRLFYFVVCFVGSCLIISLWVPFNNIFVKIIYSFIALEFILFALSNNKIARYGKKGEKVRR